jgi:NADH-quinone oxidoreductase subunit G
MDRGDHSNISTCISKRLIMSFWKYDWCLSGSAFNRRKKTFRFKSRVWSSSLIMPNISFYQSSGNCHLTCLWRTCHQKHEYHEVIEFICNGMSDPQRYYWQLRESEEYLKKIWLSSKINNMVLIKKRKSLPKIIILIVVRRSKTVRNKGYWSKSLTEEAINQKSLGNNG